MDGRNGMSHKEAREMTDFEDRDNIVNFQRERFRIREFESRALPKSSWKVIEDVMLNKLIGIGRRVKELENSSGIGPDNQLLKALRERRDEVRTAYADLEAGKDDEEGAGK